MAGNRKRKRSDSSDALDTTFTEEEARGLPARRRKALEDSFDYEENHFAKGFYSVVKKARVKDNDIWDRAAKIITMTTVSQHLKYVRRELEILRKLNHPNICRLEDSFRWHNREVHLLFELCRVDLFDFQNKIRRSPIHHSSIENDCIKLILQKILTGVEYMHSEGVLHRDLKTENILLTNDGEVKITDFGLGRLMDDPADGRERHYSRNIGTQMCMAPELLSGSRDYGGEVDVWSVGIIAHDLYTFYPFQECRDDKRKVFLQKISDYLGPVKDIPKDLRDGKYKLSPLFLRIYTITGQGMPGKNDTEADFVQRLLTLEQAERPSAHEMLTDAYFKLLPLPAKQTKLAALIFDVMDKKHT